MLTDDESRRAAKWGLLEAEFNADEENIAGVEPAWGKAALGFRTGIRHGHKPCSIRSLSLVRVKEILYVFRERAERGDTLALLSAVRFCADENLPMPTWLAQAYSVALDGFLRPGGLNSLDEVFKSPGLPTNTRAKVEIARRDWQRAGALWRKVHEIARRDQSICSLDAALRASISDGRMAMGLTTARKFFNMIEVDQLELHGSPRQHLSQILEKRRKI